MSRNGTPLDTANRDLEIWIFDAATGEEDVYGPQEFPSTPVVNGFYNVLLGPADDSDTPRGIESALASGDAYLEVRLTTPPATEATTLSPRQRIVSAPFAIQSLNATNAATAEIAEGVVVGGISGDMIEENAIGAAQLQTNSVGENQLASGAVTSAKIADGAVITERIANGSITTDKFAGASIAPRARTADSADRLTVPFNIGGTLASDFQVEAAHAVVPGVSVTIESTGNPVHIALTCRPTTSGTPTGGDRETGYFKLREGRLFLEIRRDDGTAVYWTHLIAQGVGDNDSLLGVPASIVAAWDHPEAGTHTYTLYASSQKFPESASSNFTIHRGVEIMAMEVGATNSN